MSFDRKSVVINGVFVVLCCLLGSLLPVLVKHIPPMAAEFVVLALFLGLIALLGYAKRKYKDDGKP